MILKAIVIAHVCFNWGFYIILSWLPTYFTSKLNVNIADIGWFIVLPYIFMVHLKSYLFSKSQVILGNFAGWVSDRLIQRGYAIVKVRKGINSIAFFGPAFFFIILATTPPSLGASVFYTSAAMGLASFGRYCNVLSIYLYLSDQAIG